MATPKFGGCVRGDRQRSEKISTRVSRSVKACLVLRVEAGCELARQLV